MNLYFRLVWTIVRSLFKPKIHFSDRIDLILRILPNDIDINRHLNNGRYLTLLDLGSIEFFMRTGVLFKCIRNGIRPMIGGVLISYRKGLSLFEKTTLTLQVRAWDERWTYFKFEFRKADGRLAAAGYLKGAFVSKAGVQLNRDVDRIFGFERGPCTLPADIERWVEAEAGLV